MDIKLTAIVGLGSAVVVAALVLLIWPGSTVGCAALPLPAIKAMKQRADHLERFR